MINVVRPQDEVINYLSLHFKVKRAKKSLDCLRPAKHHPLTAHSCIPNLHLIEFAVLLTNQKAPVHATSTSQCPIEPPCVPTDLALAMDVAYDHIQEETLSPEQAAATNKQNPNNAAPSDASSSEQQQQLPQPPKQTLNAEFQEAYNSLLTSTPWGAKLGGFFSDVKKQSTSLYDGARQEATAAGGEAFKGFADLRESLVSRARSLSTGQEKAQQAGDNAGESTKSVDGKASEGKEGEEGEGMVSRFRAEAAKRLKELEKAEEAADAAIFRFGANIGNFLKDAVSIAPPSEEKNKDGSAKVLFESKGEDGKRVIHGTRFEAQLHAIHTSRDKFLKDPEGEEWEKWKADWNLESEKGVIGKDEERSEELKRMRERLVPGEAKEDDFWRRYYFLRMIVESEEKRRKEVLKGKPSLSLPIPPPTSL